MSIRDMRTRFVEAFPLSQTRGAIIDGLAAVVQRLSCVRIVGHLWADGSFLTRKIDPDDVDLLLRITGEFFDNATVEQREAIVWYVQGDLKASHHCDCYVSIDWPCDHPAYMESEWWRAYWIKQYGFSRGVQMKGIAVIELPGNEA